MLDRVSEEVYIIVSLSQSVKCDLKLFSYNEADTHAVQFKHITLCILYKRRCEFGLDTVYYLTLVKCT